MISGIEYSRNYQEIMLDAYEQIKTHSEAYSLATESADESLTSAQLDELKRLRYQVLAMLAGLSGVSIRFPCYVPPDNEPFTEIRPILTYTDLRHALQNNMYIDGLSIRELFTKSRHSSITANTQVLEFAESLNFEWFLQRYNYQVEFVNTIPDELTARKLYVITKKDAIECAALTSALERIEKSFTTDNTFNGQPLPSCTNKFAMRDFVVENFMSIIAMLFYGNRKEGAFDAFKQGFSIPGFNEHLINIARIWNKALITKAGLDDVKLTFTHLTSSLAPNYFGFDIMPSLFNCNTEKLNDFIANVKQIVQTTNHRVSELEKTLLQAVNDVEQEAKGEESSDEEIVEIFRSCNM